MQISLKLIFISDLVYSASMIVNQNFKLGVMDLSRTSYYKFPLSKPSAKDNIAWIRSIGMITNIRGMILYSIGLQRREVNSLKLCRHRIKMKEFKIPYADWVEKCVKIINLRKLQTSLFNNKLFCVTDGSFCPDKSHLVAAAWIVVIEDLYLATGDFATSVPMDCSHPHVAELCRVLFSWCLQIIY